jgi:hypothetical protein
MIRSLLLCVCFLTLANLLQAQTEKYNPYAPVVEEPPISEDGKINWPKFFKSTSMEERFQGYFATGSCVGTNMRIVDKLEANKVDVNKLPRTTLQSVVFGVKPGMIATADKQGAKINLLIHPKGVSKVEVSGEVAAEQVAPGMIVRFRGAVDSHAKGIDPINSLEVISLTADLKPTTMRADHVQMIVGKVERHSKTQLVVNTGAGTLRKLTFVLPNETQVYVNGSTLDLAGLGDSIEAEGPIYSAETGLKSLFAEKLTVKKATAAKVAQAEATR